MVQKQEEAKRKGGKDCFEISTRGVLGFRLMEDAYLLPDPRSRHGRGQEYYESIKQHIQDKEDYNERLNILPGYARHEQSEEIRNERRLERLRMGALGGLALIAPMLIMVLHHDLLTTLMTTSLATILFAGALAWWGTKHSGEAVLGAVAAYAAVLVVFVGTSS